MANFKLGSASGDPWTSVSPNLTASSMSGWETQFNASVISQIDPADFASSMYPVFNVKAAAYGATGDGTTDDTVAIQAAVDAAEAVAGWNSGGIVYLPRGDYAISGTIRIKKAVRIQGEMSARNGNANYLTSIVKIVGSGSEPCFLFQSATLSEYIHGAGLSQIDFTLNSIGSVAKLVGMQHFRMSHIQATVAGATAPDAIELCDVKHCYFTDMKIAVSNGTDKSCILLNGDDNSFVGSGTGGTIKLNVFARLELDHPSSGGDDTAGGVVFKGNCDRNAVFELDGSDTNTSSHPGFYAVLFSNTAVGGSEPRCNSIYGMKGHVRAESGSHANRILQMTSVGSGVTCDTGSQLSYSVVDCTNKGLFETQSLAITDSYSIDLGSVALSGSATEGTYSPTGHRVIDMPDAATSQATIAFQAPRSWSSGLIESVTVAHSCAGSTSTEDTYMQFGYDQTDQVDSQAGDIMGLTTESMAVRMADTANSVRLLTKTFASPIAFTANADDRRQLISFMFARLGSSGSDTLAGETAQIHSITLNFKSGPQTSSTVGPWEYGLRGVGPTS